MSHRIQVHATRLLIAVAAGLSLTACSSDFAATMRRITYPPDFVYVSDQELRNDMQRLGRQLALLEEALLVDEPLQPDPQEVMAILSRIERIGSDLQAGDAGASHAFLENDMPRFANDVMRARMAASMDPPRYYLAGRVAGSCVNCHSVNR